MNIEKQLKLSSGEMLDIPERLHQIITAEKITEPAAMEMDDQNQYLEAILNLSEGYLLERALLALQVASVLQEDQQKCDESVLYFCLYADRKAHIILEAGDQKTGFELLSNALELGNSAFSCIQPSVARHLADQMIVQAEEVIRICSLSGSIQVLIFRKVELRQAMEIALTFWEPEFASIIQRIEKDMEIILKDQGGEFSPDNARTIYEAVILLKKDVQKQTRHKLGSHSETLKNFVDAILEMFQQELLLTAHTMYTSDGLNSETIQYQAKRLVEKVEKRLRAIIAKKYQEQFGGSWVQHISSRFQPMYERWQRYMRKDQSAFRMYNDYSPEILDYALLEDLKDLIVTQWQLFRDVFNFGYQDRNRSVFLDKISQIVNVRNALAHHRMPPENELLRTRVLCTDILLALDRAGEINE